MTSRRVSLDTFMEEFAQLEQNIIEVNGKNNMLQVKLDDLNRLVKFYLSKEKSLSEERDVLLSTVNRLQRDLQEQCNLRVENDRLKKDMVDLKRRSDKRVEDSEAEVRRLLAEKTSEANRHQRALEAVRQQSRREVELAQRDTFSQLEAKDAEVTKLLQEKSEEVEEVKTRLKNQEREKQSELLKLQMEFGAKLARVQSSAEKNQQQQQQGSALMPPQSVFKRKLQFMQEEKNREITALCQRIKELEEKQRISSSSDNRLKRRKI